MMHSVVRTSPLSEKGSASFETVADWGFFSLAHSLYTLMNAPVLLFLATLTIMLFRPPDVQFYSVDRVALGVLIFFVLLRTLALGEPLWVIEPVTLPMLALMVLAFAGALTQPYDAQTWSIFAAKWLVPFALYHLAILVFTNAESLRKFETFSLVILAYLSLIAIFFLLDARSLIFPRFILDESLGIHADRARGPFLQAVANGVSLNLLGLIAMDSFRRRRLGGMLALLTMAAVPLAILATKTRAVWASFAGSLILLALFYSNPRVKRASLSLIVAIALAAAVFFVGVHPQTSLSERLQERSPVEFRMGMYRAGWEMFTEKPLLGWEAKTIQPELARRISDFHPPYFIFHNTYLDIVVKHGLLGLFLYSWVVVDLFRLTARRKEFQAFADDTFLDTEFRKLWPGLLIVYLVNASFVVMDYQFVNGLLFTIAGMIAGQNRRAKLNN